MNLTPSFSASVLNTPNFDDFFDDLPPSSRPLPPLQDAIPALSTTSRRPSPSELQLDTCIIPGQETFLLTSRQQALAKAKPLDACEPNELEALTPGIIKEPPAQEAKTSHEHPRKKQKLYKHEQIADFVHLPKPQAKAREENRPPFRPIAVLHQLHEPPPSVALFPPITSSASQDDDGDGFPGERQLRSAVPWSNPQAKKDTGKKSEDNIPTKRIYTRKRTKWTEQETEQLVKGVAIYGMGRWKHILDHPEFDFNERRTPVDLKDRFRVCFPPNAPAKWAKKLPEQKPDSEDERSGSSVAACPPTRKRALKRAWTEAEDDELEEGFRRYGYQWNLIAKDESLQFNNRSGSQVRDRFRLRYPQLYAQQSSAPLPPMAQRGPPKKKKSIEPKNKKNLNEAVEGTAPHSQHNDGENGSKWTNSFGLNGLPHGDEDDTDTRLSNALWQYEWDDSLTLAPISWEDMVPQPMFDLG